MAVSDRPNICAVLCSLVLNTCAVARSLVFVMTSIPTSQFCHQHANARARRGGHASIRREGSTIERVTKLYVSTSRREEDGTARERPKARCCDPNKSGVIPSVCPPLRLQVCQQGVFLSGRRIHTTETEWSMPC